MYGIVADVERYPEFVPWCASLRIESREPSPTGETLIAETVVGFKSFRERYTSKVTLDPAACKVDVVQTQGVFRHLENHWHFVPEGEGCRVEFSISFEFKSRVLALIAEAALGQVMARMTRAFETRAKVLSKKNVLSKKSV
jgi:coenzyme Q-binding protein COQ10